MFPLNSRILIVDDMMTMRKIVGKTLKDIGFTDFIEAADGSKAWEALNASPTPVTLIISDWNMPVTTGTELLKKVRSDSKFKTLPFILVTAEAEAAQVKEALILGVTGYVVKPFTTDSLKAQIEAAHKKTAG